jgi:hypothetical protein
VQLKSPPIITNGPSGHYRSSIDVKSLSLAARSVRAYRLQMQNYCPPILYSMAMKCSVQRCTLLGSTSVAAPYGLTNIPTPPLIPSVDGQCASRLASGQKPYCSVYFTVARSPTVSSKCVSCTRTRSIFPFAIVWLNCWNHSLLPHANPQTFCDNIAHVRSSYRSVAFTVLLCRRASALFSNLRFVSFRSQMKDSLFCLVLVAGDTIP